MANSAINTQVAQQKIGNVQNQADSSAVYSAGAWSFKNASAVTSVTIDSGGSVGIGTTSPIQSLHVNTPQANLRLESTSGTNNALVRCINTGGTAYIGLDNSAAGLGAAYGLHLYHSGAYPILLSTNGSERVRIDSAGVMTVGGSPNNYHSFTRNVSSDWSTAVINGSGTTPQGLLVRYTGAAPNSGGSNFFLCLDTAATRMNISSNGGIANYSANNVNLSDRREKTDFAPAKSYLETICKIPVQTFKYIDQTDDDLTLGVVAQDVQAVAPELVSESNWGTAEEPKMRLSIYQTDLQYALMKSIQELAEIVKAQAAEIAALKAS